MEATMSTELKAAIDSLIALGNQFDEFWPPISMDCFSAHCMDNFKEAFVVVDGNGNTVPIEEETVLMLGGEGAINPAPWPPVATNEDLCFLLDSGASCHATPDRKLLRDFILQTGCRVVLASGYCLQIIGTGALVTKNFTLNNVRCIRGLTKNIVSVSMLTQLDYSIDFSKTRCFIRDAATGEIAGEGRLVAGGLFQLDFLHVPLDRAPAPQTDGVTD